MLSTTPAASLRSFRTERNVKSGSGKEGFIRRLFDEIASGYDLFNRVASLGLDRRWRRRAVDSLSLRPGMRMLDLASGTGDLAAECARRLVPLGTVVAADLSAAMLAAGSRRLARIPAAFWHVRGVVGRAEALPFADASFDAITMGFALRNVADLEATFAELHRVVRPGGRLALLEFGRPSNPFLRLGHWLWLSFAVPAIGILTTRKLRPFLYLRRSILSFLEPGQVLERLRKAGFREVRAEPLTRGTVLIYLGA